MKKSLKTIWSIIILTILVLWNFFGVLQASGNGSETQIGIEPQTMTVPADSDFILNITINPSQDIAGAQCNIQFDPNLLSVVHVEDGGMFDFWFDLKLSWDNATGVITNISAFDFGAVNTPGIFAKITFHAKTNEGTTSINLNNVLISDTGGFPVPIDIINGSVTIEAGDMPPNTIIESSPPSIIHNREATFEWTGTDDNTLPSNLLYSYRLLGYSSSWSSWTSDTEHTYTNLFEGSYTFEVRAKDNVGNIDPTPATASFTVDDNTPPSISNVNFPSQVTVGSEANISCSVTDDFGISLVKINITYPDSSFSNNSMNAGTKYYYSSIYTMPGTYFFTIWAQDTGGNGNKETGSFEVVEGDFEPPEISNVQASPSPQESGGYVNITCSVTDNVEVNVVKVNIQGPSGFTPVNATMNEGSYYYNSTYTLVGTYYYFIWANDTSDNGNKSDTYSFEIQDTTPPDISSIQAFPSHQEAGGKVKVLAMVTDNVAVANVFLNITYPDSSTENFSIFQNKTGNTYYSERTYDQLGTYTFFIFAIDSSNNKRTSSSYTFEIEDNTPPSISSIETSPIAKGIGEKVNISAMVTDNVAVANVFLNITYPDSSTENFSIFQNKTGNTYYSERTYDQLGTYTFFIFAIDSSGNKNASGTQSFVISDITPPTVKLIYPLGGENISGTVKIKWNATDNYKSKNSLKVTLKYSSDGGNLWHLIAKNQENDGEYKWNTTDLEDGSNYRIMVKVNDSKNEGSNISGIFTIDNTPPSVSLQKPKTNYLYLFNREIMPILRHKAVIIGKITITANANDTLSGIDKVEFFVDNVSKHIDTKKPYEWEWDETIFFCHTLKVVATDKAGNTAKDEIDISIYNI